MLVRFDPESDIFRASLVGSHAYLVVDLQVMPFSAFLNPRVRALCLPGLQDLGVAQLGNSALITLIIQYQLGRRFKES